jgi:hypothetical protein
MAKQQEPKYNRFNDPTPIVGYDEEGNVVFDGTEVKPDASNDKKPVRDSGSQE